MGGEDDPTADILNSPFAAAYAQWHNDWAGWIGKLGGEVTSFDASDTEELWLEGLSARAAALRCMQGLDL